MSEQFKFFRWHGKKAIALLVVTLVLSFALVNTAVAFLIVQTQTLINEFTPQTLSIAVSDDGKGVVNDGEATVYVRATVVVTWDKVGEDGTVMAIAPVEGTDYTLVCNSSWVKAADGFWYYPAQIKADKTVTIPMIELVEKLKDAPYSGYELSVELLLDAIQATPSDAVLESWTSGVSAVAGDGTLTVIQ